MNGMDNQSMLDASSDEESQYNRPISHQSHFVGRVVSGEAPDSDTEEERLTSSHNSIPPVAPFPIHNQETTPHDHAKNRPPTSSSLKSTDPYKYKKHIDRNKGLLKGLTQSFLEQVVVDETKRLEKLSQNLSNTQMQMQESLLQSRIATGNLLRIQMELKNLIVSSTHLQRLNSINTDG